MVFADINKPLPMEGEEFFDDGKTIRFSAGLRQVLPGDLIMVEWPTDQSFGTGNWIKGGLTRIEYFKVSPKEGGGIPVLQSVLDLEAGWHTGSYRPEVQNGNLALIPQVKVANIPWHWELRTDDVPGWNLFVIGHNCKLHEADAPCLADDRRHRANEARERRSRESRT